MNPKKYAKLFFGTLFALFLIFFNWKASYPYYCFSLLFPLIMMLLVSYGFIELKMEERNCFRKCYFMDNTLFSKLLSSRFFVVIFYILASFAMTLSAFSSSIDYPMVLWAYLLLHIFLSILLFGYLNRLFGTFIQERYQSIFAREWTIHIMGLLLVAVFIYLSLNTYLPTYLSESLQETIKNASDGVSSSCDIINYVLKFGKTIDSSFWWIIDKGTSHTDKPLLKAAVWIAFLFYNSLALLGINRLIVQIIYILDKLFGYTKEK